MRAPLGSSCPALAHWDSRTLLVLGFVPFLFFPLFLFRRRRTIPGDIHPGGTVMKGPGPHPCTPVPRGPLQSASSSVGDLFGVVGLPTPPPLLSIDCRGDSNASLCVSVVRVVAVLSPYFRRLFISSP